ILDYGFIGHRLRGSNGVSIYFPCFDMSQKYAGLSFAEATHWDKFLDALAARLPSKPGSFDIGPNGSGQASESTEGGTKSAGGTPEKVEPGAEHRMPAPLPRRRPKYPTTTSEEPKVSKTAARRKKVVAKK